jgi:hypothetical protein
MWIKRHFNEFNRYFDPKFWLILFGFVCGIYLFFLNPALLESYSEQWLYAYLELSRTIFLKQSAFYAESVFFPLLAFLFGTSKHWLFYKILCSFFIIFILPSIVYFSIKYFNEIARAWLFVLLFVLTYRYLWRTYYLGYPDHITIICLAGVALQRQVTIAFVFTVLAAVSHFSMALISLCAFLLLILTAREQQKIERLAMVKCVISGLIVGRLLLEIWFYRFNYKLQSRFDWALEHGLQAFMNRYEADVALFWLTPGLSFLSLYFATVLWFIFRRHFYFAGAMIGALALGYLALFLTVDGLRVFAVVISAPYVFILRTLVNDIFTFFTFRQSSAECISKDIHPSPPQVKS